jgi:hypothetical protein
MKNILADWRYDPEEWHDFTEFEKQTHGREIGDIILDNIFWVSMIIAISMLFCGLPGSILGVFVVGFSLIGFLFLAASLYIHGFRQSLSAKGNCNDNPQSESLFSRFKIILVKSGRFESVEQARSESLVISRVITIGFAGIRVWDV